MIPRSFLLNKGDVLVARTGATYGKTVVFDETYPESLLLISSGCHLIQVRFFQNSTGYLPRVRNI